MTSLPVPEYNVIIGNRNDGQNYKMCTIAKLFNVSVDS